MRKFLSFVAIASLSVCAFAQEANVVIGNDQTVTSQPSVEPMPVVADQTVMMTGNNGMYTMAPAMQSAGCGCATPAPSCGTCDSCCETTTRGLRGRFARTRGNSNSCCQPAAPVCNTCDTCCNTSNRGVFARTNLLNRNSNNCCQTVAPTCNTCNTCDSNRGVFARTNLLNRNSNNCCQTAASTCNTCSTCATATYTSAPIAAPVVQDVPVAVVAVPVASSCCAPAVTDCCEPSRNRILGSRPVRTRFSGRRGNNCGC